MNRKQRRAAASIEKRNTPKRPASRVISPPPPPTIPTGNITHIPARPTDEWDESPDSDKTYEQLSARGLTLLALGEAIGFRVIENNPYIVEEISHGYGGWSAQEDAIRYLESLLGLSPESTDPNDIIIDNDYRLDALTEMYDYE